MNVNSERKYVIVCNKHIICNKHTAIIKDALLFWGSLTDDNREKRSFGGYTCQIDKCERYTRKELEEFRGDLKEEYPFFEELKNERDFFKKGEVLISIDDLKEKLHFREFTVLVR